MTDDEYIVHLKDQLEFAWAIIANVSYGQWDDQSPDWVSAAEKFSRTWRLSREEVTIADILET